MTDNILKIGIIGLGHWGPNYLRVFNYLKETEVKWACDKSETRLQKIDSFSETKKTTDFKDILEDPEVQAVIIATPAQTHFPLVKTFLENGKDVLAEKPLALKPEEAQELCQVADRHKRILMVGHTFIYNPGIQKIKKLVDDGELGKIYYLNATRTHLGLIRDDVNSVWDLAPHDISIFNFLLGSYPVEVSAVGASHLKDGREDVAFINLVYPENVIANIHVSWEDSNKERKVRVVGSQARVVFDDLNNLERVKLYKKGIGVTQDYDDFGQFQLQLRDGDIISPMLNLYEPLQKMCGHFVDCVFHRTKPISDGESGYHVVRVLHGIQEKMIRPTLNSSIPNGLVHP